jgi:hypothetical protein
MLPRADSSAAQCKDKQKTRTLITKFLRLEYSKLLLEIFFLTKSRAKIRAGLSSMKI